jgi:predicted phosphatase
VIILDVNRRRFICRWFEYLGGSAANFFGLLLLRIRIVSIEGDRMLEGSSAQHANVYLRSRRIHIRDIWREHIGYTYVVYVRVGV